MNYAHYEVYSILFSGYFMGIQGLMKYVEPYSLQFLHLI